VRRTIIRTNKQARNKKQKGGLSRVAYDFVLRMIVNLELPGGTVIQERKLADSLGVSRTPMREALGRLEGEGWLVRLTDRLLSVKVVTLDEYLQALQVRRLLETEAVVVATPRMSKRQLERLRAEVQALSEHANPTSDMHWRVDGNLHGAIAEACGNTTMTSVIANLRLITQLFEIQTVPRRTVPGCAEHLAILDALVAGDPKMARKAMRIHLDRVRAGVMDVL
jgi:DNA-binding GntR family transcriptional regulator